RRQNLLVRLFEFDFTVTHRKGELNRNADFFSRWAADKGCEDANEPQPPTQPSHGQRQTREQPIDLDRDVVGRKEEESDSFQCFATHIAADTPPMVDDADSKDKEDPDFTLLRQKVIEEQRKDPKLKPIIDKLLAAAAILIDMEDEST